jgi:hypothetical protein
MLNVATTVLYIKYETARGVQNEVHVIIIIFIYCNWVITRWQWLFNTNTKHEKHV